MQRQASRYRGWKPLPHQLKHIVEIVPPRVDMRAAAG
jgi:hypothetical protein